MATSAKLRGKSVLVTGAARGIGAETARQLVAAGANLAMVGLEPELSRALVQELGSTARFFEADVSDRAALERAVEQTVAAFGGIDLVLSNAGVAGFGTIRTFDSAQFERTIAVNLIGTWNVIKATLPQLLARRGYFLANASIAAGVSAPGLAAYSASKAGTESLCDTLRLEVAHHGVDVGVAYLSWVATDLVSRAETHPGFAFMRQKLPSFLHPTAPVERAARALVDGLAKRRARVFLPRPIQLLLALRWPFALQAPRAMGSMLPELERLCEAAVRSAGGADKVVFTDPKFR